MSDKHRLGAGAISLHDGTEGLVVASHGGGAGLGEGLEAGADHRSASASRPSPSPAPPPWLATTRPSVPSCSEIAPAPSRCLSLISPRSSGAGLSTIAPGPQRRASPKWTISPTNSCAAGRKRRHGNKSATWIAHKYWRRDRGTWDFAPPTGPKLPRHNATAIQRHRQVQGSRSPFDGDWVYWGIRLGRRVDIPRRTAVLLNRQRGICPRCGLYFRHGDLLEIDHLGSTTGNSSMAIATC